MRRLSCAVNAATQVMIPSRPESVLLASGTRRSAASETNTTRLRALRENVAHASVMCVRYHRNHVEQAQRRLAKGYRVRLHLLADHGGTTGCQCLGAIGQHLGGDVRTHALEGKSARLAPRAG